MSLQFSGSFTRVPLHGIRMACLLTAAVLVLGHLLFLWRYPITITPDATYYLEGARHLAEQGRFATRNERFTTEADRVLPIADFPPGYSALMAMPMRVLGLDAITAAKLVNTLAYLVFLAGWGWVYRSMFTAASIEFSGACLLLALDRGLMVYLNAALSEMVFAAALAGLAVGITLALRDPGGRRFWWGLAVMSAAGTSAVLTRNAGVGFLPGVAFGVWVALRLRGESHVSAALKALLPSVIAAGAFGAWCVRNLDQGNQAVFVAYEPAALGNWPVQLTRILGWFNASVVGLPVSLVSVSVAFWLPVGVVIAAFVGLRRVANGRQIFSAGGAWLPTTLAVYGAVVTGAGLLSDAYSPNSGFIRYFSVLQPILTGVLLLVWRERETLAEGPWWQRWAAPAAVLVLGASVLGGVHRQSFIFSSQPRRVDEQELYRAWLRQVPRDSLLISNVARRVAALADRPVRQAETPGDIPRLLASGGRAAQPAFAFFSKVADSRSRVRGGTSLRLELQRVGSIIGEDTGFVLARVQPPAPEVPLAR